MSQINRLIAFDAGIEQILTQNDPLPVSLPDASRAAPADGPVSRQLDEVLTPPSVEQALIASLRPDITQRDILSPVGYEAARQGAAAALNAAGRSTTDPAQREVIGRALDLLDNDRGLQDLLSTYRNILHRA